MVTDMLGTSARTLLSRVRTVMLATHYRVNDMAEDRLHTVNPHET